MADQSFGPGSVIDGKYRLTDKLGEGGMGSVWRAEHLTLSAPVAVKLLDATIANTEDGLARFMREAQAAAALRSSHVVQTFDYGVHQGVPFIVMELLVGESLADRLEKKGPMAPEALVTLMRQVARAMQKAHQNGIIHRDLKPDNIFLVEGDGEELPVAKVLDFGIAKSTTPLGISSGSKTRTGALLGTPYYMSPEQVQGVSEVDYRTDLWALAIICFEALTGRRPFDSEALGDLLVRICTQPVPVPSAYGAVPPGFDQWFARAANRDPAARFTSATEMMRALESIVDPSHAPLDGMRSLVPPPPRVVIAPAGDSLEGSEVSVSGKRGQRRRNVALIAATLVAALVVVVTMSRSKTEAPVVTAPPAAAAPVAAPRPEPTVAPPAPVATSVPSGTPITQPGDTSAKASHKATKGASKTAVVPPPKPAAPAAAPAAPAAGFDPLMMRR